MYNINKYVAVPAVRIFETKIETRLHTTNNIIPKASTTFALHFTEIQLAESQALQRQFIEFEGKING